jgi:hypothetical protein
MKITGFSFIRNAVLYDFPIVEALKSILPICDEIVVAVGHSNDQTLALIQNIDPTKIRIIETTWNENLQEGGKVLADETNKALAQITADSDWAFYIQGDEVIHQNDLPAIRAAMNLYKNDSHIDGLLFNYKHFYGSYDYLGDSPKWYSREIRIIRPAQNIYSYRDAQGFRKNNNQKLTVKPVDACIYHYGWVKSPQVMQQKHNHIHKYWYGKTQETGTDTAFDFSQIDSLAAFTGTHPQVMQARVENQNWNFDHDISFKNLSLKNRFKMLIKKLTGWQIGEYKNFIIK